MSATDGKRGYYCKTKELACWLTAEKPSHMSLTGEVRTSPFFII